MKVNLGIRDDQENGHHWRFNGGVSTETCTEDTSEEQSSDVDMERNGWYSEEESCVEDHEVQVRTQQERVNETYVAAIGPLQMHGSKRSSPTSQTPSICGYSTTYKNQYPIPASPEPKTKTRQARYRRTSKRLNPAPSSSPTQASSTYVAKYWTTRHCECKECRREKRVEMPRMSPRMFPYPKVMLTMVVLSIASCAALFRLCLA